MDSNRLFVPRRNCGKNCKRLRKWKNPQAYFQAGKDIWTYDGFGHTLVPKTPKGKRTAEKEGQHVSINFRQGGLK